MPARDINIDLDIDLIRTAKAPEEVSRLSFVSAWGYTRDGGAPTLTADCMNYRALEREAERLKAEIDDALRRAREHYGEVSSGDSRAPVERKNLKAQTTSVKPRIEGGLLVRDLMTQSVRTLGPNDALSVADELMDVSRVRHAIVVEDDTVVGVISRRDIFHGALAWSLGQGAAAHQKTLESYPAKQVMETDLVTIDPDATLAEAAKLMLEKKIGCLPVVDGGKLLGILTESDFLALTTASSE